MKAAVPRLARLIWFALLVFVVYILVMRVHANLTESRVLCAHPHCQFGQVSPDQARLLHHLGLPLNLYDLYNAALGVLFEATFIAVAALIIWRRPSDFMALFTAFTLLLFGGIAASGEPKVPPGVPEPFSLLGNVLAALGTAALFFFFYLFPDGRPVRRWLIVPLTVGFILFILPGTPGHPPGALALLGVLFVFASCFGIPIYVQVYRYRNLSTPVQRQQTKWIVYGVAVGFVGFLLTAALSNLPGAQSNVFSEMLLITGWYGFFMLIPLVIGFAILRHRLWEIDLIINRTLVYVILTASVLGLYVLVVVGLGALFQARGSLALSLLATACVAILAQPLRERLQRGINRLMYGQRDDPYQVVSRLGRRLEASLSPGAILPTIAETVADALKLPYVAIALERDGECPVAAASGSPAGEPLRLPLVYQGSTVGQLIVSPRTGTRDLNPADRRLLSGLAHQAGIAAHAVRLADDLQRSRERLVIAREEERRRLRRDLHDGLGPTLASLFQRLDVATVLVPRDPKAAVALLDDLKGQVRSTIADIRRLVYALRPPTLDEYGLVSALREHALQYNGANGLRVSLQAPEPVPPLPAAVEVAAYRIALEALTNVARHAHAHSCSIRLTVNGELCLEITDDGAGLPALYRPGVGLTSMRERAAELGGECTVESDATGGTRVLVRMPINKE